ncbi:MAG TPA: hypothetical protein VK821_09525 [Dehalococcoidia bacterium]|nr:hypothetical protein [Dehalococcoidia bacterium]
MLATRLEAPARLAGLEVAAVSTAGQLAEALSHESTSLVLLDLADAAFPFAETLAAVMQLAPQARCIAIYPHVRAELGKMAQEAGCELVLPRSRFFMDIAGSLSAALAGSQAQPAQAGGFETRPYTPPGGIGTRSDGGNAGGFETRPHTSAGGSGSRSDGVEAGGLETRSDKGESR